MSAELLSPEDLARLEALFERAVDLSREAQRSFVERECGPTGALRDELLGLLEGAQGEDVVAILRSSSPSRAGTRIGPYKLLERVGEGGMGEVYAAEQQEPIVRKVALKIIKPGMDSAQVVARFSAERQALARMSHPNVAQVFDGGRTESGSPYFVMEFVSGEPITEYCDRHKLSTRERIELFRGVCAGVQHAHQKGIIHRDLKPSNVMIAQQDGRAVAKVIDFGVARATTGRLAEMTLHTMVGQVVGTIDYMSPEQADPGGTDIDTRSDIYSLGVLLYQILSGCLPFDSQPSVAQRQRVIRDQDPPTPSTRLRRKKSTATSVAPLHATSGHALIRQLSGDLDWICLKALEKEPARRYASASELDEDLRRHLAHEPVLAGRPGALYRARKYVRRHRVGVTASLLVAAATIAGAIGTVSGRVQARASERMRVFASYGARNASLSTFVAQADGLWPASPGRLEALLEWLAEAKEQAAQLDVYRHVLADQAAQIPPGLADLIRNLEQMQSGLMAGDGFVSGHGWSIPKRIDFARRMVKEFAPDGAYAKAWADALPQIHAAYPELQPPLTLQMGLVPIGPDPESGLWEFAHLQSGEPAVRGTDRRLWPVPGTGIVLVLLRSDRVELGAQSADRNGANFDAEAIDEFEGRVSAEVPAFFISKYELTQSQWERAAGSNPSMHNGRFALNALDPVNQVDWDECDQTLGWLGLMLPSESQWEYAARAGTSTAWYTGDDPGTLEQSENILDQSWLPDPSAPDKPSNLSYVRKTRARPATWDDGWFGPAPVGSFRANGFGLHDVLGNVAEWTGSCLDAGRTQHILRGGSYRNDATDARSAAKVWQGAKADHPALGLRPARAIDP